MSQMSGLDGLVRVMERMAEIQQRFQPNVNVPKQSNQALVGSENSSTINKDFSPYLQHQIQGLPSLGGPEAVPLPQRQTQTEYSGNIEKIIYSAAQKYGVDPKLALAVAKTESGLSPNVVSPAGAVGVMQLMPETAAGLGVRNVYDPRENIDGGVRYLRQMLDTFQGDVSRSIAAYNAGPEAVKRYGGIPPYSETQQYVQRVLAYYRFS